MVKWLSNLRIDWINFSVRMGLGLFFSVLSLVNTFEPVLLAFGGVLVFTSFLKVRRCERIEQEDSGCELKAGRDSG